MKRSILAVIILLLSVGGCVEVRRALPMSRSEAVDAAISAFSDCVNEHATERDMDLLLEVVTEPGQFMQSLISFWTNSCQLRMNVGIGRGLPPYAPTVEEILEGSPPPIYPPDGRNSW